jgi:hypothetical protein
MKSLRGHIAQKPFDVIYDTLRKRCAMTLESSPVSETQWRDLSQRGDSMAALKAARTAQGRIMDLLVAHHIDSNAAYRDRALEELKNLVSWSVWHEPTNHRGSDFTPAGGPPAAAQDVAGPATDKPVSPPANSTMVDLCTAEAGVAAVVGLDWLWNDMTEVDRLRVIHALRHRVIEPYRQAVAKKAWWYSCSHSWNAVINSGCGLVALALSDEEPSAREAYQQARAGLKHFFDALGREGGWEEGLGFWGYAMRYLLLLGEAARRCLDDQSIFHCRGMDATGLFPVYFTPHGRYAGFGELPKSLEERVPLYGALYLLVKHFGTREIAWWLDRFAFHRDVGTTDWSAAGLAILFRPTDVESPTVPDLQPLRVFHEIGWAAIADTWLPPSGSPEAHPSFYVSVKTGDLSANHSHRDMCSLQLQVQAQTLLSDLGLPPYPAESADQPHGEFFQVQAANHNTLLVGCRDHHIEAQGEIVEAQVGRNFRWVACDAGIACGENVHHMRHVIMLVQPQTQVGKMLLVLDEVQNAVSERIDLFWHSPGKVTLDKTASGGRIEGQGVAIGFAMTAGGGLSLACLQRQVGHQSETILHGSIEPASRAAVISVFSREPIRGKVGIKRIASGETQVKVGAVTFKFKASKRHLQLQEITGD